MNIENKVIGLDITRLKGHVPESIFLELPAVMNKFHINTPLRLAHFLGQTSHESAEFKKVVENLNYSAQGLANTFPKYFPTLKDAEAYARKPEMIASKVYGNRMGNGDEASKDGWKFRGRGAIQLTGKANYIEFGKAVGLDLTAMPDLVATQFPLVSAAWFWDKNKINELADKGATVDAMIYVTKKINGGTIGLPARSLAFKKFWELLS